MTNAFVGQPIGMAPGAWKAVKEINGDLGYADLLRQGIASGSSILSLARQADTNIDRYVKDDAPLLTSTTGAVNPVYGRDVYVWTNLEHPAFGALAKQPWTRSGRRIKTANSSTLVEGYSENDAIPASTLPTYALMKYKIKNMITRLDWTLDMQVAAASGDDTIGTPEQLRADKTAEHMLGLGTAGILYNAETYAAAATGDNSGVSTFEALDRVISCDAEEDDLGGTYNGCYDPWAESMTADRDSGTTYDAVVVHGDGTLCYQTGDPAFDTDATLTLDAKNVLLKNCLKNGLKRENGFWLTGYDTYFRLLDLYGVKERYINPTKATYTVNGVQTMNGSEVGFDISTMDGMPIIVDPNCPKDTIDKLFLIDRSNVFMQIATPTVNINLGFPAFTTISATLGQRLGYAEVLLTQGELCATRLNTSGKLCALK